MLRWPVSNYDLVVLGAGSGNMVLGDLPADWRVAIVDPGPFGGTCLNRGCIPTKMLVVAADAAANARSARRLGVHATVERVDWKAIRDRVFGRIDPIAADGLRHRRELGVDVYTEPARFVAPKTIAVGADHITAERFVVAVGSRPVVPAVPGLEGVPFHTSDTVMRIDELPSSMLIVGGGFIAAEFGHVFGSFGVDVTIVQRGPRLLTTSDEAIADAFTAIAGDRCRVMLNSSLKAVRGDGAGVSATVDGPAGPTTVDAQLLLVCVGRRPNTDRLDATAGGIDLDEHGHVRTDDEYRTNVPGVWALGDTANHFQLKHMANAEARIVAHNLAHPGSPRRSAHRPAPYAIFTSPQIAGIGLTSQEARERGIEHVESVRRYADTAYGWALEDTTGFVKVLADPRTRRLLGAHILGPQAAVLVQPLIQAMTLGQTVDEVARDVLYIHPALSEVVEQALLGVPG
jgi:mycothione reductase